MLLSRARRGSSCGYSSIELSIDPSQSDNSSSSNTRCRSRSISCDSDCFVADRGVRWRRSSTFNRVSSPAGRRTQQPKTMNIYGWSFDSVEWAEQRLPSLGEVLSRVLGHCEELLSSVVWHLTNSIQWEAASKTAELKSSSSSTKMSDVVSVYELFSVGSQQLVSFLITLQINLLGSCWGFFDIFTYRGISFWRRTVVLYEANKEHEKRVQVDEQLEKGTAEGMWTKPTRRMNKKLRKTEA